MKIGIDVDEVLASFMPALLRWHNQAYNSQLTISHCTTYQLADIFRTSNSELIRRLEEFQQTPEYQDLPLVAGAAEGVATLVSQGHALEVITSRQQAYHSSTRAWLKRRFPDAFAEVNFSSNHYIGTSGKTKVQVCKERAIDLLIEDSPGYASQCAEAGIPVILFDCPWNRSVNAAGIYRVSNWEEAVESVNMYPFASAESGGT